jgi:Ca2+-binding EF-hand superfamily protein
MNWKYVFAFLDVNNDGNISMNDAIISRNRFINIHALTGNKALIVKDEFDKWWNSCVLQNVTADGILEHHFLHILEDKSHRNWVDFIRKRLKCIVEMFLVFDINKDNSISLDEYIKAFHAFDHNNFELIRADFNAHTANSKHQVPLNVIIDTWMQFMTGENGGLNENQRVATIKRGRRYTRRRMCCKLYYSKPINEYFPFRCWYCR